MGGDLDGRIQSWVEAGLITPAQAAAIGSHEAAAAAPAPASPGADGRRIGAGEALAYPGVAAVLAGVLYLVFSSAADGVQAAICGLMAGASAGVGLTFMRSGTASGARAADACLAVAAALAGIAAGQAAAAVGLFTTSTTTCFPAPPAGGGCSTEVSRSGAAILGMAVSLGMAAVGLVRIGRGLLAVTASVAAMSLALEVASTAFGGSMLAAALLSMGAGAALFALSLATPAPARELMRLIALVVPLVVLFLTDPNESLGIGGVLGGAIAAAAMALSVRLDSNALVLGGGIGLFGFCIDATARSYHGTGAVPVVLIVTGVALAACGALVQWGVRRNRGRPPGPHGSRRLA